VSRWKSFAVPSAALALVVTVLGRAEPRTTAALAGPAALPAPSASAPTGAPKLEAAASPTPKLEVAGLPAILAAVRAPGARAVVVNVWASWCEPCREEMPELLRFYRDNRARGMRLVLVSADDEEERAVVERLLADAAFDGPAFIKQGDDMAFINGLDRRWSGELPSTFVFDGQGQKKLFWPGTITYRELGRHVGRLLPADKSPPSPRRKS
jgi:thiol-disulfide isomerase/thioredoxin